MSLMQSEECNIAVHPLLSLGYICLRFRIKSWAHIFMKEKPEGPLSSFQWPQKQKHLLQSRKTRTVEHFPPMDNPAWWVRKSSDLHFLS